MTTGVQILLIVCSTIVLLTYIAFKYNDTKK